MKKNMIKKTLAVLSAVSIAAVGMAAFTSVSAADAMTIDIADVTLTPDELATLNNTVTVDVTVAGNTTQGLTSYQAAMLLDDNLTFSKARAGENFSGVTTSQSGSIIGVAGAEAKAVTAEGVLFTLTVVLPDDAADGSVYSIDWTNLDNTLFDDATPANLTLETGSITIAAAETTTAAPETTVAATTTTAAATTAATTTTTAATTVAATPKTGSTGIAATAAVLVAAAGAAVVVSKKRK